MRLVPYTTHHSREFRSSERPQSRASVLLGRRPPERVDGLFTAGVRETYTGADIERQQYLTGSKLLRPRAVRPAQSRQCIEAGRLELGKRLTGAGCSAEPGKRTTVALSYPTG